MKDHIRAQFINKLRDTAISHKDCQSLRAALAGVVNEYLPKDLEIISKERYQELCKHECLSLGIAYLED